MKRILTLLAVVSFGLALPSVVRAQKSDDDLMSRVIANMQAGKNDEAIVGLTEIIKLQPNNADAYFLRSNLKVSSGDSAGALADLSKAIEIKSDVGSYYYNRAIARVMEKDMVGALKDLDLAIVNNYKIDPVYTMRAQIRLDQNDVKGALADFDEAIKLNPNNPRSYLSRAQVLIDLGTNDRAFADLNYLLIWYETDPTKRQPPKLASKDDKPVKEKVDSSSTVKNGKVKEDPDTFTVQIDLVTVNEAPADKEMIPVIANAYVNRGLIFSSRGNTDAAIADFTKSIRISPSYSMAYFYRALELEGKGDLAGALSDINKTVELEPLNGNTRVEHGVILSLLGRSVEAKVDFDMLLKSDPVLWQKRIDERTAEVTKKLPSRPK